MRATIPPPGTSRSSPSRTGSAPPSRVGNAQVDALDLDAPAGSGSVTASGAGSDAVAQRRIQAACTSRYAPVVGRAAAPGAARAARSMRVMARMAVGMSGLGTDPDRAEDRRAEDGRLEDGRDEHREAGDVGLDLVPRLAPRGAAAGAHGA